MTTVKPTQQAVIRTFETVQGVFSGKLKHKELRVTQPIYVVKELKTNLLGLPAMTSMKLIARVDATSRKWFKKTSQSFLKVLEC